MKTSAHFVFCLVFLFLAGGFYPAGIFAQDKAQKVEGEYSRPSLTFFVATPLGDYNSGKAAEAANSINFSDKYFNHNLDKFDFPVDQNFRGLNFDAKKSELKKVLDKQGIGRKMIAKWFSRQDNGMFNLDNIHQCGLYNASDQDVLMSGAAKRGEAVLFDAGEKLVNKTYVLVISPYDLKYTDDKTQHGWNGSYDVFLYKLDFNSEVVSRFYDQWPFDDDPEDVKRAKIAAFDTLSFTVSSFYGKQGLFTSSSEYYAKDKKPKTSEQLLNEAVASMYNDAVFNMDKDLEPFRVKMNVSGTRPIRSKIGKKEGLRCEQRYFVYEYVWNDKTGTADQHRKAVVRATGKITDNRGVATGSSGESRFYQVYGGTVRQGMIMQQRNDAGISFLAGYELGGIGGFDAGLMVRTGIATNVPSLYLMADLGFDTGSYEYYDGIEDDFSFFRYSVGIGKGIRLARIVELTPYAAWGQESTSNDDFESIKTTYIKGGGMLGINITSSVSVMGQVNFYVPYGGIETKIKKDDEKVTEDFVWTDKFTDRSGMSMMFGLRFEF